MKKTFATIALLSLLFLLFPYSVSAAWYNASWPYRVAVTVQNAEVDADLTDFPVYVDLNDLPAGFHTNVTEDAGDIRVTTSDGTTEVPREVVFYATSTDTGELHFKGTLSNASDTVFYIYYGNASADDYAVSDTYGRNNTWSAYDGVWHLQGTPTGSADDVVDATGGGNDLTSQAGMGAGDVVAGNLSGNAYQFTTNDWLSGGDVLDMGTNDVTISTWVNTTDTDFSLFAKSFYAGTANRYAGGIRENSAAGVFGLFHGTSAINLANNTGTATYNGSWHHYALRWDRDALMAQILDGAVTTSTSIAAQSAVDVQSVAIFIVAGYNNAAGTGHNDTALELNGTMDEVRFSYSALSAEWLTTEHSNQSAPASFYSVGAEEPNVVAEDTGVFINNGHILLNNGHMAIQ